MKYKRKQKRYKVGQVVLINVPFYKKDRKKEQYQKITKITPWPHPYGGDCLTFLNGDMCHEIHVRKLNKREANG